MKANELMIGDWVCCTDPKPFKIVEISIIDPHEYITGSDGFDVDVSDLQPIPLTAEILNSNFPDVRHGVFWSWNDIISSENVNWFELRIEIGLDEILTRNIRYVHELQHALRLCGIEKEVVL